MAEIKLSDWLLDGIDAKTIAETDSSASTYSCDLCDDGGCEYYDRYREY